MSVAVVQGSQVTFQRSSGNVDKKTKKSVDEQTVFRAASLSKPVFAYFVMKIVEEGCDNYAVIFLDRKTGIVLQSVTHLSRSVAPGIVKEVIGDVYSPFTWLRY